MLRQQHFLAEHKGEADEKQIKYVHLQDRLNGAAATEGLVCIGHAIDGGRR